MSAPTSSAPSSTPITAIGSTPAHHHILGLLTWKNPQKTAKVFGASLATLFAIRYLNIINIFFRIAFITLFVSGAGEYVGKLVTGNGFASRFRPAQYSKLSSYASQLAPKLEQAVSALEAQLQSIVFAADIEKTLKFAALSYVLYKITSLVSLYTVVVSSLILAFTAPAAYVTYQKEIHEAKDKYFTLAKSKAAEYKDIASEKSKPYVSQVNSTLSPYTSKFNGYLPKNRTAGSTIGEHTPSGASKSTTSGASDPTVGTTTGSSAHSTTALPKVPTSDPVSAQSVDIDDLKQSIKQDKEAINL